MKKIAVSLGALSFAFLSGCGGGQETTPTSDASDSHSSAPQQTAGSWRIQTTSSDLNQFFDCLDTEEATLVSAHRGGPRPGYPENAVETFAKTLEEAPALMEMDVATSADGVLYLMHDDTLNRTTTGVGEANAADWADIEKLFLVDENGDQTAFHPPSFSDALAYLKNKTITQIDFKRTTRFEDVIDEVKRQDAEGRVILIAYSLAQARKLHRLAPNMMISLSVNSEDELAQAISAGIPAERIIGFTGTRQPNARLYSVLEYRDVEVIFGTLGGKASIDNAIENAGDDSAYSEIAGTGVDILATDRPIAAHNALAAAKIAPEFGECGIIRE